LGGVFAKNISLETKFPSPFGSGNFSSLDWYFSANAPPKHDISVYNTTTDAFKKGLSHEVLLETFPYLQ
jgi:hypothetical protein